MRDLDTIDQTGPTLTASARIMEMIQEELDADTERDLTPWRWWDVPITPETRRAAFDIDTGRLSGLVLIAELEGLPVVLEVL